MNRSDWAQREERSNLKLLRAMTWVSLNLGRRASRALLVPITAYFLAFSADVRRASRAYLARVLGRPARWRDVWRHVWTFASTVHDRIYLLNGRFDLFDLHLHDQTLVGAALAEGRGAFLMGAHLGSFEVCRTIGRSRPSLRVAITMYEENARHINAILATVNPAAKQDVIPLGQIDSMLKVREYLDTGSMIGMLADRTLLRDGGDAVRQFDFLGAPAAFPLGPLRMAAMLRRPVIFMTGLYRGGNRYEIHFEPLADFTGLEGLSRAQREARVEEAVAAYARRLERYCRAAPDNFFNFYRFWR